MCTVHPIVINTAKQHGAIHPRKHNKYIANEQVAVKPVPTAYPAPVATPAPTPAPMPKTSKATGHEIYCITDKSKDKDPAIGGYHTLSAPKREIPGVMYDDGQQTCHIDHPVNPAYYGKTEPKYIMNTKVAHDTSYCDMFDQNHDQKLSLSKAGGSDMDNGMYSECITCEKLTLMYKASGKEKYMKDATDLCDAYLDTANDYTHDGYLTFDTYRCWRTKDPDHKFWHVNHDHDEWRAASGMAMVCNQIMCDPKLKEKYGDKAERYKNFIEKNVWEKWSNLTGRNGDIVNNVPGDEHMVGRLGKIALNMYNCTGEDKYYDWLIKNGGNLKDRIEADQRIRSDAGHAEDTANFIAQCYAAGLVFTKKDMDIVIKDCKFKSPDNVLNRDYPPGWAGLAQFDDSPGSDNLKLVYQSRLENGYYSSKPDISFIVANFAAMKAGVY